MQYLINQVHPDLPHITDKLHELGVRWQTWPSHL